MAKPCRGGMLHQPSHAVPRQRRSHGPIYDDELKIFNALVVHAKSHSGALPDASHLLANLTFDKTDANEEKLTDKIRKLRARYRRSLSHGCPSGGLSRQLFKLSKIL
jgi:hypothetical protein